MKSKCLPKIIVIVGPNASGKSDLAIKLAKKFNGEIISADSRQVYRGMDIGTGKVTKKEQKIVKHHLIDVVSPKTEFTASHFKKLGEKAIKEILAKGPDSKRIEDPRFASSDKSRKANRDKTPIICGGTGFYIDTLVEKIQIPEVKTNKKLRLELERKSVEELFKQLRKLDPERAKTIDSKNKRRLIRALEIIITTGKPVPAAYSLKPKAYSILWLGIKWPKEILEKRIKIRLDKRLKQGMIKEVENLLKSGVSHKRLYDFGLEYRQISEYLKNSKSETLNSKQILNSKSEIQNFKKSGHYQKLLREIIKYSKRQMTWFKRNKEINWVRNQAEADTLVKQFYS